MATVTQFRRRRRGPLLGVEFLERRLALTGSVTAMVVGSGDLLIQGDLADNAIAVTLRDEQISVASLDGSTVINGGTEALFDPAELTGDLRIALGAGVNSLRVGGETHETEEFATAGSPGGCSGEDDHDEPRLTVPGDLLILGGGETDTVAISFVEIGGRLSIHSLAGDDTITVGRGPGFGHDDHGEEHLAATVSEASENTGTGCDDDEGGGGPPPDVRVAGDFFVIGGPGNDRLKVAFAEIGGGMRLMTGPGEDTVVTGRGPIQGVHGPGEDGDCGGEDHDGGHSGGCEGHEDPGVDPPHVAASGATAMGDSDCAGGDTSHPGGGVGDAGGGPHRRPVDVAIGLDFRIDLGPGDDFAMLRNTKVGGSLKIFGGPGDDALGAQNLRVHEDAAISSQGGDDIVAIWQSTIHGLVRCLDRVW